MISTPFGRCIFAVVLSLSLVVWVGCGDDDPSDAGERFEAVSTGIAGAWIGGGDYLIAYERRDNGETTTTEIPGDETVPDLVEQEGSCQTGAGLEVHPWRDLGPIFGSQEFTTRVEVGEEDFELELIGGAEASTAPRDLQRADYRTGDNAWVLRINNGDEEPVELETSWAVERWADADDGAVAETTLDLSTRIYVGEPGDCQEVTDEYELFEIEEGAETPSGEVVGSEVVEFEAERVKLVLEANGGVVADVGEGGSAAASLRADLALQVQ